MSRSKNAANSSPFHSEEYAYFKLISFWSKKVTDFVNQIEKTGTNTRVSHHDLLVNFINNECFGGIGELDHEKRIMDSKHDDLTLPSEVIEFKFRSTH